MVDMNKVDTRFWMTTEAEKGIGGKESYSGGVHIEKLGGVLQAFERKAASAARYSLG